jgi:hypothetical protein
MAVIAPGKAVTASQHSIVNNGYRTIVRQSMLIANEP